MPVDLHVHTTASDGALTPSDVVRAALRAELSALAVTDHDTVGGVEEALEAAEAHAITVVPGVELSVDEHSGSDVHVLGLLIDHRDSDLVSVLVGLCMEREERARTMVTALAAAGHRIDLDSVRAVAGRGSIGRVHIARALVDAESVTTIEAAFRLLIGREAPFYRRKRTLDAQRAVAAIHDAGGVAVLAHPGVSGEAALAELLSAGIDGIEAFHAEHSAADRERFARLAAAHGLIVTGGSDCHGPDVRSAPIGGGACPDSALEALLLRAARYSR
jgi:predicted metal-dependent phosphoesterase TrpH